MKSSSTLQDRRSKRLHQDTRANPSRQFRRSIADRWVRMAEMEEEPEGTLREIMERLDRGELIRGQSL